MAYNGELNLVNKLPIRRSMQGDRNLEKVEASLAKARALIKQALLRTNDTVLPLEDTHDYDYVPQGDIYRNAFAFHRYDFMKDFTHQKEKRKKKFFFNLSELFYR